MKCSAIKKSTNKVCLADLNKRIKIQTSSIAPNNAPNGLSSVAFTTILEVWAMIKTSPSSSFIDGVNVANGLNTDFYIRYNSAIPLEKQLWIEYDGNLFKISFSENIDKENKFVRLRSVEKGDKTTNANKR